MTDFLVQEEDKFTELLISQHSNIPLGDCLIITRNLTDRIEGNFELFVNFLANAYNKNTNINLFFNHFAEGLNFQYIKNMNLLVKALMQKCNIRQQQVHLISGAVNSPRLVETYKNLCNNNNWYTFSLWIINVLEISSPLTNKFEINFEPKTKRILCYNQFPRIHRIAAVLEMYKRQIIDKAYVSIEFTEKQMNSSTILEICRMFDFDIDVLLAYKDIVEKNKHKFPMKLTLDSERKNAFNICEEDKKLMNNTVVSLVNETVFSTKDVFRYYLSDRLTHPCTLATEKFWKTFQGPHPFIVLSTPHYLKDIRYLGYKTFYPYIDESYDDIEDDGLRFKKVMDEVERFANMTDNQVYDFQQKTKDILEFNDAIMRTKKATLVRVL